MVAGAKVRNDLDLEAEESAQHAAQRAFGNAILVKEDVRAARMDPMIALLHEGAASRLNSTLTVQKQ